MGSKARLKKLRIAFREGVFKRDDQRCVYCDDPAVDAHHITDRSIMPNDGYATENGVSVCAKHHMMVEVFHISHGCYWIKGYHPDDVYAKIGSSIDIALEKCMELA